MRRPRWPAIRAGLITLAILVGLLDGCPVGRVRKFPLPRPVDDAIAAVDHVRLTLLRPFRWIGTLAQVEQRWALFAGASQHRWRMRLEGRIAGGPWQLVFRAHDLEHAEYAELLQYRRLRGVWSPGGKDVRSQYSRFSRWIADRMLADHPELVAVRIALEQIEIGEGGGYTPTGVLLHVRSLARPGSGGTPR